jgi:predicted ribosomally synthesized peptide with SipW-like signal peptide
MENRRIGVRVVTAVLSRRGRALLSLGLALGLTSVNTLAYWSDQAEMSGGMIRSGSLDLLILDGQLLGTGGEVTNPAMTASAMIPGESFAFTVPVQRKVDTAGFALTATATAAGALASHLQWAVFEGSAGTQTTSANGLRTTACGGTQLSNGVTLGASAQPVIASSSAVVLGGSVFSKNICVRVTLPSTAANAAQSATATATFNFAAAQLQ